MPKQEQRQLEAVLQEERARLAAIVQSSDDAIIAKTLDGIITSWNPGAQKIYGYSAEEAVGQPISMLAPPERSDEIPGILERVRSGAMVDHYETVRLTKDGKRIDISLSVSPIRDSKGNIVGASAIARDISDRKRAEEAMQEVREVAERARMARDLHDGVLQDLSYAATSMELAMLKAEDAGLRERLQGSIDAVRRAVKGLREAVNNLRLEEVDLPFPQLVSSLVERSRIMDPECHVHLEVEEGFPPEPLGDVGAELSRVIQEALTNARRHSGAGEVRVALRIEGGDVVAEVADDGCGFGPETEPGGGSRSMRERALRIGGSLEVESTSGEGTRVRVRAPMHAAVREAP